MHLLFNTLSSASYSSCQILQICYSGGERKGGEEVVESFSEIRTTSSCPKNFNVSVYGGKCISREFSFLIVFYPVM